jgi:ribonucleoside-diphosphate reductase alpha chain
MKKVLKSGRSPHVVINPRTQQRYLLPKRLDFANYTIADLHELSPGTRLPALRTGGFYTVADIWDVLIRCAHATGEPGLVFIDRINRDNPTPALGPIEATNPCGEQPLLPYEACTLGSINLVRFMTLADGRAALDWPELARTVALAVRFLDNIIDVCNYPIDDTARLARANRKIGLGVMGFADCLFLLGIPYDSRQGVEFGSYLMKFINDKAHNASAELAEARGSFANWDGSIWRRKKEKLRNAAITCAAPTGTISIIADCSCGIEPAYSLVFTRQVLDGTKLLEINPIFKKLAEKQGFYSKKLERQIAKTGSIQRISAIPAKIRRIFRSAYDIKPDWHIKMQAAFQDHCDAAVSKTINLPENAARAAVEKAYKTAYRLGCKGITVYRRGSRSREPMALE